MPYFDKYEDMWNIFPGEGRKKPYLFIHPYRNLLLSIKKPKKPQDKKKAVLTSLLTHKFIFLQR